MGYLKITVLGCCSALGLGITGCNSSDEPGVGQRALDPTEATSVSSERIDQLLTGLSDATATLDTSESTSIATDGISGVLGNSRCGGGTSSSVTATATNSVDSLPTSTTDALGQWIGRVRDEAKQHVFRDDLVEAKDGKQVVYKMDPAQTCDGKTKCIEQLTQNPLRFAVTANTDDSLNVAMLIGQERHNPATALLAANKLSVRGNLAEVMDSIRLFMNVEEQKSLPERLTGVVEWSIEKRSEGEFVFSSAILERFDLLTGQAKGKPVTVTIQPSNPTSQVTINSVTNHIGFKENVGSIDVSATGSSVCGDMDCGAKEQSGTFGLHFGGFTGEFETTAQATEVTFTGLGLGADSSYLALNGQHLATVDVNPSANRKFSMNFKKTDGGTLVTFEPALDFKLAMAMTNLSESMRVDMPDWLFNEVFEVSLGGAPKPSILIPAPTCDANGNAVNKEQLKLVTGKLTLSATSLTQPLEVMTGMCLVPVENQPAASQDEEPHPFTLLGSGVCQ